MDLVEVFKAFGDETRMRILNLLKTGELCVCQIEAILNITQSNASRHLNKLRSTGIISCDKKAQWVFYKINNNFIKEYSLLYEFFLSKVEKDIKYASDMEKLKRLKLYNLGCKEIEEDREKVLMYLNGKN